MSASFPMELNQPAYDADQASYKDEQKGDKKVVELTLSIQYDVWAICILDVEDFRDSGLIL